ncbi:MAG: DNA cytosine methyltransferase [Rhodospirillales bacterium]
MLQVFDSTEHIFENGEGAIRAPTFIDAFAGCGGLSLGLMQAGWQGLFAIEKDSLAFSTLEANFLSDGARHAYDWPDWLPKEQTGIDDLMKNHSAELDALRGKVDLLAGGPPCQGFSSAGRRDPNDPRNKLVGAYLELVRRLEPDMVLLENVRGITYEFSSERTGEDRTNYSHKLVETLEQEYEVFTRLLKASSFGVPQKRPRFFMIAFRKGVERSWPKRDPFTYVGTERHTFFQEKGLSARPTARLAISDLEVRKNGKKDCPECKGFHAISYKGKPRTGFQKAMRDGFDGIPSDTRLARHQPHIVERFKTIIEHCKDIGRLNTAIPKDLRNRYGLKKQAIRVMDPKKPAPTITSMPDDLIHYDEPRTLTVRENARLQTFPDWFVFKGKYTTGGDRRRREVPRFTQVANAVPPLLAELIGKCLMDYRPNCDAENTPKECNSLMVIADG